MAVHVIAVRIGCVRVHTRAMAASDGVRGHGLRAPEIMNLRTPIWGLPHPYLTMLRGGYNESMGSTWVYTAAAQRLR